MKEITYKITDELGIHARPAGQLVKRASEYRCRITAASSEKSVDAKRIMGVMGLTLKKGDVMTMTFDGPDEEQAASDMADFLKDNL